MTKIENANTFARRYFGLHMAEGCAQYQDYMIFISDNVIRDMGKSFEGKPVFVEHRDVVEAETPNDGYVVKSFFNEADGKHWVEFLVNTTEAINAIASGAKLSNAYHPTSQSSGGRWHGIDYDHEIMTGEYEHLAIVTNPRYAESIILTPEEFHEYNENKKAENKKLSNSLDKQKTRGESMFNFFKKEKIENSLDLESMSVVLPKSKREVELKTLINEADEEALLVGQPEYAVEHMLVKLEDGEMSVGELVNKYNEMCAAKKTENEVVVEKEEEVKKENEEEDEEKEKHSNALLNAEDDFLSGLTSQTIDLSMDQVARGKARYGSK